mgnify:CR=1 FL=1
MLRFFYNWFRWVPIAGGMIKAAYIGSLVAKIVAVANGWAKPDGFAGGSGAELDSMLDTEANALITEVIEPLELGIVADIVRRAAVGKVVKVMRKKIVDVA